MNKDLGPFARNVCRILQARLPQIKPDVLEDAAEQIDISAKDSVEIQKYWRDINKSPLTD